MRSLIAALVVFLGSILSLPIQQCGQIPQDGSSQRLPHAEKVIWLYYFESKATNQIDMDEFGQARFQEGREPFQSKWTISGSKKGLDGDYRVARLYEKVNGLCVFHEGYIGIHVGYLKDKILQEYQKLQVTIEQKQIEKFPPMGKEFMNFVVDNQTPYEINIDMYGVEGDQGDLFFTTVAKKFKAKKYAGVLQVMGIDGRNAAYKERRFVVRPACDGSWTPPLGIGILEAAFQQGQTWLITVTEK